MTDPIALLREHAPWSLDPELAICVVGSGALAEACRRSGIDGPRVHDLDLSWALPIGAASTLLERHGVALPTTTASQERGTLAMKLGEVRVEITSFRGGDAGSLEDRICADLMARDMTIGALAWWLDADRILDPSNGLAHWRQQKIVACGDPQARIREHPVRWIRYYRRAHEFGFELDNAIRKVSLPASLLQAVPTEALAAELRSALLQCRSAGRFLLELHEKGLLATLAPELVGQFDGRPAGPVRHHPEVSQALHIILCLEWLAARSAHLANEDRAMVALAVLCHDLGKGVTPASGFPSHRGHEAGGVPLVYSLFDRLRGLGDASARRMAAAVARLHLEVRRFDKLRAGTLAKLYDEHFRHRDMRIDLFAMAVGADVGGRLGREADGEDVARKLLADLEWLRARCGGVDARALRDRFADDTAGFKAALHEARCAALRRK